MNQNVKETEKEDQAVVRAELQIVSALDVMPVSAHILTLA